jgi:hypothetical protein
MDTQISARCLHELLDSSLAPIDGTPPALLTITCDPRWTHCGRVDCYVLNALNLDGRAHKSSVPFYRLPTTPSISQVWGPVCPFTSVGIVTVVSRTPISVSILRSCLTGCLTRRGPCN